MAAPTVARAKYQAIGAHLSASADTLKTLTLPGGATGFLLQVGGQNARYTIDGNTAPTASVGFRLLTTEGQPIYLPLQGDQVLKVISEASGSVLQCQAVKEL